MRKMVSSMRALSHMSRWRSSMSLCGTMFPARWTPARGRAARFPSRDPVSVRHAKDGLDRSAARRVLRRTIDRSEVEERHHPVDRQLSEHHEIDELRDELTGPALTLDHPAHHPAL